MKKIYNKNAREKALLEEAYCSVYTEEVSDISAERWSEEWDFDDFPPQLNQAIKEFEENLSGGGDGIDTNVIELKDIVDEIVAANVLDDDVKEQAIGYLKQRAEASHLAEEELYGEEGIFSDVDDPPYVPEWEF